MTQCKNDVPTRIDFLLSQEVMRLAAHFTFRRFAPPSLEKGRLALWRLRRALPSHGETIIRRYAPPATVHRKVASRRRLTCGGLRLHYNNRREATPGTHISYLNSHISILPCKSKKRDVTNKAVYRHPFTVHRPSHRMSSKVLTHGSRLHSYTVSGELDAPIASSQKLGASSNLASDKKSRAP